MVIKNEKKISEFGKEFGKVAVEALNYQENIKEIAPKETAEDKARLYIHLAESGQITERPLMTYEEALKRFQKDMKAKKDIEESKTDLFKFKTNLNLKKPKTDYGALTVKALRRMK